MKAVKTTSRCHKNAFNLLKGNTDRSALEFIWHVYWISFVCLSGLYTGSSTPHHSASVELLSPTPNPASASTTDLPCRQHRLDRDLGSPHHVSPLAAMEGTRDGWVLRGCLTRMYSAVETCHTPSDTVTVKGGKIIDVPEGWEIQTLNLVELYISCLMSEKLDGFVTVLSHYQIFFWLAFAVNSNTWGQWIKMDKEKKGHFISSKTETTAFNSTLTISIP